MAICPFQNDHTMLNSLIRFFLENKPVTLLLTLGLIGWGIATAPFNWEQGIVPTDPVPVDAIPDIGENQQIVFTEWMGRSPQDMEDQVTYPLTTALLGIPGVKTIRSSSMFGVSSIYLIFEEGVEFYWSRSRILEKLNSLPPGTLPEGVKPALGPDATALGQIFWYTLEGRDEEGNPSGGWDPQELRSIQDFYVKYSLLSAEGVTEVASIGGFVKEYQVDIDPIAMKSYGVNVSQIMRAVEKSNMDVGARTIEFNRAEYLVRGLGYIEEISDLEAAVVVSRDNVPVRIKDVARVYLGPATRRGGLDKAGAEAVGAVVVARYGSNPLDVINNVKQKINEVSPGLPSRTLEDGTLSKVTIVPFYDRTGLIKETLGTLEEALTLEILISILVVIILVLNIRASLVISAILPIGVLITFILMRYSGVDANIVALSGIAIAIGVMVDVGIVFTENIVRHLGLKENRNLDSREKLGVVLTGASEVAPAVITALATTVISFIPVFALQDQEGKLFGPLAFTKTYALVAALLIGLMVIPALSHSLLSLKVSEKKKNLFWNVFLALAGVFILFFHPWPGILMILAAVNNYTAYMWPNRLERIPRILKILIPVAYVLVLLSLEWLPLGAGQSGLINLVFVGLILLIILGSLILITRFYQPILLWCLDNKAKFLILPVLLIFLGILGWQGFEKVFKPLSSEGMRTTDTWSYLSDVFPGVGKEFMPPLDEGSFLLMPTTMPHSGIQENMETIQMLDKRVTAIPEVEITVGKWGRVSSALDPAPISMFENVINYKPEYILDEDGHRKRFKTDKEGNYLLINDETFDPENQSLLGFDTNQLIPDPKGNYFRQWRPEIKSPDDIWDEIVKVTNLPGMTSAPKLQPISTRLVMLSTGMRAPMGIKVYGPDLNTLESVGLELEKHLQNVEGIKSSSVFADRVVGKPYMEIDIDRRKIARYGLSISDVQMYISTLVGGNSLTTTVEGRERYQVRVRYAREYRDNPDDLMNILIPTTTGNMIPLKEIASLKYTRGPQNIKSENTFLVSYVIFDKEDSYAEADVVENAQSYLSGLQENGQWNIPPGVSYKFAGNYENQLRAADRLSILIPLSLFVILLILYFQFRNFMPTLMVFSGVFLAFAGGFILIWLFGKPWFLDFDLFGENVRNLFQVGTINLSVAVWVGFIALFGVASDNGVLVGTYLQQRFSRAVGTDKKSVREAVIEAASLRIRPAMMTTATTMIALLPIFTSTGKGSEIMVPMAIPTFGGMVIQIITVFTVPVLYSMWKERQLIQQTKNTNR